MTREHRPSHIPTWVKVIVVPWAGWISLAVIQTGKDVAGLKAVLKIADGAQAAPRDRTPIYARFGFPVPKLLTKATPP